MQRVGRAVSPEEAVAAHRAQAPEEPALFFPDDLDFRWLSWRTLDERVDERLAALAAGRGREPAPLPAGDSAACGHEAVIAWLARRRAGSRTRPPGARADPDEAAARLAALGARLALDPAGAPAGAPPPAPAPGTAGRQIVLAHLDLRRPEDEACLGWVLVTGAALVLEPDLRAVPGSAAWARPTVVVAPATALAELARRLRTTTSRPGRVLGGLRMLVGPAGGSGAAAPFGRLRRVIVVGDGRLPVDDVPFWAERAVSVLRAAPVGAATSR